MLYVAPGSQSSQFHLLLCTLLCMSISSSGTSESLLSFTPLLTAHVHSRIGHGADRHRVVGGQVQHEGGGPARERSNLRTQGNDDCKEPGGMSAGEDPWSGPGKKESGEAGR